MRLLVYGHLTGATVFGLIVWDRLASVGASAFALVGAVLGALLFFGIAFVSSVVLLRTFAKDWRRDG